MKIKFGEVTASEINVMLTAHAESGDEMSRNILNKQKGNTFELTKEEAEFLCEDMYGDADRVGQAMGESAGRAFERGAEKLEREIEKYFAAK